MLLNLEKYKNVFDNYTELRVQENRSFRAGFLNGNLITNNKTTESGVSSRVFKDGNWGFSSNAEVSDDSINSVLRASNDNVSFLSKRYQGRCGILLPETMFNYEMNLSTSNAMLLRPQARFLDNHPVYKYFELLFHSQQPCQA